MELIKIQQMQIGESAINAVSARDLHNVLEVKTRFNDWIKRRLDETMAEESVDYSLLKIENTENTLFQSIEYIISIDIAKEIAMLEKNDKGKEVRKYFIECEKQLTQSFKVPQTYAQALLEAGRLALENEKLLTQAKENAPKIKCFDELMDSKNAIDFMEFSKIIGIGRTTLFQKCRELGVLMQNNQPYQKHIDSGHFRVIESTYTQGDTTKSYTKTMILPKGQAYLTRKIKGCEQ